MRHTLSVLTMVSKRPHRVVSQLTDLRALADEIVVTAHDPEWLGLFAPLADQRLLIDPAPKSRHLGWLLAQCQADWILVLDDDEVLSPGLAAEVPRIIEDDDITHALLPRRWAHPTADTYITTRPWSADLQLQLLRNVPALWRFPGRVHQPLEVGGRGTIAREPLYHLALLDKSFAQRAEKYRNYESANPGRWTEGIPINLHGMPELVPGLRVAAVPAPDQAAIERFQAGATATGPTLAASTSRLLADADHHAESRAEPSDLHENVEIALVDPPGRLRAGSETSLQVDVVNRATTVLGDAIAGSPVHLAYHWLEADGSCAEWEGRRSTLWARIAPGTGRRQLISVLAPESPGLYALQPAAVHEGCGWFAESSTLHLIEVVAADASVEIEAGPLGRARIWTNHLPEPLDRSRTDPEPHNR
jgi:hypothetical protein